MFKTNKRKLRGIIIIPILILLAVTALFYNTASSQTWKFAVISDTHDDDKDHTATGVTPYLAPIIHCIVEEKPDMVFETGDLIVGALTSQASPVYKKYDVQYENYQQAVKPLKEANIPLFVIRGNHDYGEAEGDADLAKAYKETFAEQMPQNGPADAKGLTYSVTHKKIKFIMLDQYVQTQNRSVSLPMDWLKAELENQQGIDHVFVMGHSPAYAPNKEERVHFNLYDQPVLRDQFWNLLADHHVTAYICGHKHVYFRGNVRGVEQIDTGNLGSALNYKPKNVDKTLMDIFPATDVTVKKNRPGYVIFTVDSAKKTITANEYSLDENNNKYLYDTYQFTF